jgi:hypothetical protein
LVGGSRRLVSLMFTFMPIIAATVASTKDQILTSRSRA